MVSGNNETVYKTIWDCFFKRTCKLMDVILNTCVSTINELTTLIQSELEKDLHLAATRYTDDLLLSSR